jgi:integrase
MTNARGKKKPTGQRRRGERAPGPFIPAGRTLYSIKVPLEKGGWKNVATGTGDKKTADAMYAAVDKLGRQGSRQWDLLKSVTTKDGLAKFWAGLTACPVEHSALTGKALEPSFDKRVEHMRNTRDAKNLVTIVPKWYATKCRDLKSEDTAQHYRSAVYEVLAWYLGFDDWDDVPADAVVLASVLSETMLSTFLADLDDLAPGTVRKKGQGLRDFCKYLKKTGALMHNPMREVELPSPGAALAHHVDTVAAKLLADAQEGQYRLYSATIHGTGMEVSTALTRFYVRHVNRDKRLVFADGTKNDWRKRWCRVAEWAWPYVEEAIKHKLPDALVFDEIPDRWIAADHHDEARDALIERGHTCFSYDRNGDAHLYTMRDARHTWAVRATSRGTPIEHVARQLGHKDGTLAQRVYGRYVPDDVSVEHWEKIAAEHDEKLFAERAKMIDAARLRVS